MASTTGPTGRVVVVGSANMDIIGRVPHLPAEGETVLGTRLLHAPGGKGANQAVAAARAGSSVSFIGRVGDDAYGEALLASLREAGVDTTHVTVGSDQPSGVALILVDRDGNNSIAVIPGANGQLSPADINHAREAIAACDVLLLQLEIPLETVEHAARLGRELGKTVILNPAPARGLGPHFLQLFDVVVPNREELGRLSGVGEPLEPASAAKMLMGAGVQALVVTLGAEGAVVLAPALEVEIPAVAVEAVDTTGAGDAFVGNLAHELAAGREIDEAARFAVAAAGLSVQREGAQPSMPAWEETEQLLRKTQA